MMSIPQRQVAFLGEGNSSGGEAAGADQYPARSG